MRIILLCLMLGGCATYCDSRTQPTLFCGDYP